MALITCPECGKQISETTPSCPHCGYLLSTATPPPTHAAGPSEGNGAFHPVNQNFCAVWLYGLIKNSMLALGCLSEFMAFLLFLACFSPNIGNMLGMSIIGGVAAIGVGFLFFWMYRRVQKNDEANASDTNTDSLSLKK